jgi:hypothetical protein
MKDFISVGRNFRIYYSYTTLLLSTIADASSSQS